MKRTLLALGILILVTISLVSTELLQPRKALAFCDASQNSCEDNGGTDPGGTGGGVGYQGCAITYCQTTCTGPLGVECCCFYNCPSGGTWVCKQGVYCANSHGGCIW